MLSVKYLWALKLHRVAISCSHCCAEVSQRGPPASNVSLPKAGAELFGACLPQRGGDAMHLVGLQDGRGLHGEVT